MKKKVVVKENKRIRKGDKVMVIAGNDRGQIGEVLSRTENRITVSGVNVRKKHMKAVSQTQPGGIIEMERPIHISNVRLCVDEDNAVKLKVRKDENGNRELYYESKGKPTTFRSIKKS